MKWHLMSGVSRLCFAPDGGGGSGGSEGGDPAFAAELGADASPTPEAITAATDWLKTNTQDFDPKKYEGKERDLYEAARTGWTEARRNSDPWKGTDYEGIKVPDKFIIEKDGKKTVNAKELAKSYSELERAQFRRRDEIMKEVETQFNEQRRAAAPATPGDYTAAEKMKVKGQDGKEMEVEAIKIGDRIVQIIPDDPALNYMREVAHKMGVPQAEFHDIVKGYVTASLSSGPKWENEAKALGGPVIAEKREARVMAFLKGNVSEDSYNVFAGMPSTAKGIMALEELMTLSGHPAFVPESGDVPGDTYTRDELKKMQSDPRYTGEGRPGGPDKEFVAKVRAGYRRLNK